MVQTRHHQISNYYCRVMCNHDWMHSYSGFLSTPFSPIFQNFNYYCRRLCKYRSVPFAANIPLFAPVAVNFRSVAPVGDTLPRFAKSGNTNFVRGGLKMSNFSRGSLEIPTKFGRDRLIIKAQPRTGYDWTRKINIQGVKKKSAQKCSLCKVSYYDNVGVVFF